MTKDRRDTSSRHVSHRSDAERRTKLKPSLSSTLLGIRKARTIGIRRIHRRRFSNRRLFVARRPYPLQFPLVSEERSAAMTCGRTLFAFRLRIKKCGGRSMRSCGIGKNGCASREARATMQQGCQCRHRRSSRQCYNGPHVTSTIRPAQK